MFGSVFPSVLELTGVVITLLEETSVLTRLPSLCASSIKKGKRKKAQKPLSKTFIIFLSCNCLHDLAEKI